MRKRLPIIIISCLLVIFTFAICCTSSGEEETESIVETEETTKTVVEEEKEETVSKSTVNKNETAEEEEVMVSISNLKGYDKQFNEFKLREGAIEGNLNSLVVVLLVRNLNEDDELELVWKLDGQEIYRSNELSKEGANEYSGGIILSEGCIPAGNYQCIVENKGVELDSIEFEIIQKDLEIIEISGSGTKSTDFFEIAGGLTLFTLKNIGDRNFIVYLLDGDGNEIELLVNEIGNVEATKALYLPFGKYFLNVEHGGNWECIIKQPRSLEPVELPYKFEGSSPDVSDLILIDGLAEINYKFNGEGNFIAYLLTEYGEKEELLVNEIGNTEGSITFKGQGEKYIISVENADGSYVIDLDYKK